MESTSVSIGGGPPDPRVPAATRPAPRDRLPHGARGGDAQADSRAGAGLAFNPVPSPEEDAGRGRDRPGRGEGARLPDPAAEDGRSPHGDLRTRDGRPD